MNIQTKICGITRAEDALFAAQHGVNALGFVFFSGSKRYISPENANTIIQALPAFTQTVGLFVNETADNIHQILQRVPLNMLQFHGDETPDFCRQFHRPYLKAVRVQSSAEIIAAMTAYSDARAVLLDAYVAGEYGGTGNCFNWEIIPKNSSKNWILSGGLNPDNITTALQNTGAVMVDVSSGVEMAAGIKSQEKMHRFLQLCQQFRLPDKK